MGVLPGRAAAEPGSAGPRRSVSIAHLALALIGCALALLILSAPAGAEIGHPLTATIQEVSPGTRLGEPEGVATNAAGDTFVADGAANLVYELDPSGKLITQFGAGVLRGRIPSLAVDRGGRVYVADYTNEALYVFSPDGKGGYVLAGEWTGASVPFTGTAGERKLQGEAFWQPLAVAVDNSTSPTDALAGSVYVSDEFSSGSSAVLAFKPHVQGGPEEGAEGQFEGELKPKGALGTAVGLAIDSKGNAGASVEPGTVYVGDSEKNDIQVFVPPTSCATTCVPVVERKLEEKAPSKRVIGGIGVDEAVTGDVFVTNNGSRAKGVEQISPAGELLGFTGAAGGTPFAVPAGIAGLPSGGFAVADSLASAVYLFGAGAEAPSATTAAAKEVTSTTAGLNGAVTPTGTTWWFEYGTSASALTATAPSTSATVAATVSGLTPATAYQFRVVAEGAKGLRTYGALLSFTTGPAVASVSTGEATVTGLGAVLHGTLNPKGVQTFYYFQWGTSEAYGHEAPVPHLESTSAKAVAAETPITLPSPNTTYHFRIVAQNATGTTYGEDVRFVTTGGPLVSSVTAEATGAGTEKVHATINTNGQATKYKVVYGEEAPGSSSTPEGELASGTAGVEIPLEGLKATATYHFHVVATNANGTTESADQTFSTASAEAAHAGEGLPDGRAYEMVTPTNKHGALVVSMRPYGLAIQAAEDGKSFAYVTDGPLSNEIEGNRSPEPVQAIAERGTNTWATTELEAPHENVWGNRNGEPAEYSVFSPNLALALVLPPQAAKTRFAEPALAPPMSPAEAGQQEKTPYLRSVGGVSPDELQKDIYAAGVHNGEVLGAEHGEGTKPGYLALVTAANTAPGTRFGGLTFHRGVVTPTTWVLGMTPDLSHVVLRFDQGMPTPHLHQQYGELYAWSQGTLPTGKLELISVMPNGEPAPTEGAAAFRPTLGLGKTAPISNSARNAISHAGGRDGTRYFWTLPNEARGGSEGYLAGGRLFLRDTEKQQTLRIDVAQGGMPQPAQSGVSGPQADFQYASTDGSKVFFTDAQRLTPDSKAAPGNPDLYVCEITEGAQLGCNLTDLSHVSTPGESASVEGWVLGGSEDGTKIYYMAKGEVAPGATVGSHNVYLAQDNAGTWTNRFIATLSSEDFPDWLIPGSNALTAQTTRVSPDGEWLAFMSNRRLTGYNNTDVNEVGGPHADEEVFLFHASAGTLTCASCDPTGARPRGVYSGSAQFGNSPLIDGGELWSSTQPAPSGYPKADSWIAGIIPGWTPAKAQLSFYQSRYLDNGGRLFFMSADGIVPKSKEAKKTEPIEGTNYEVGVGNVYEWEPNGTGSCAVASGCVSLLSPGNTSQESGFLDASANGNDVFFTTASQLVPQDTDDAYDIYDARVCGSEGCLAPPKAPAPPCEAAETCRPGTVPVPVLGAPGGTSTFSGPGTVYAKAVVLPEKVVVPPTVKPTNAQLLAAALKKCRKLPAHTKAQKKKRSQCEATARKRYAPKKKGKK